MKATIGLRSPSPDQKVLDAFAIKERPVLLKGGSHGAFRAGQYVLKFVNDTAHHAWLCDNVLSSDIPGLRLQTPVRALGGSWSAYGWSAYRYLEGKEASGQLNAKIEVARLFHAALRSLGKPDHFAHREGPWARAERVVWKEEAMPEALPGDIIRCFTNMLALNEINEISSERAQIVHTDLCGNILFDPLCSPALIDVSLTHRPPEFAEGVLVYDSVVWDGGEIETARAWLAQGANLAFLRRAAAFRLLVTAFILPPEEMQRQFLSELERACSLFGRKTLNM